MSTTEHPPHAAAVETICANVRGVIAVYHFGSSAAGLDRPDSDVDLAVLADVTLPAVARFDLQERLAELYRRPVDLVDLRTASPVMAMQVLATSQLLLDAAPDARGLFEDRMFTAYARLNEERRGILDRIAAEGTVYGG
jgi:predicted nucleotidyltransferase